MNAPHINWQIAQLDQLSPQQLYAMFGLRQRVFVVEQACAYADIDAHDECATHILAWVDEELVAVARLIAPGEVFSGPTIGRVLVSPAWRRQGLGVQLMRFAMALAETRYPKMSIELAAQCAQHVWYQRLGFEVAGEVYVEDGIPHINMQQKQRCE